MIPSRKSPSIRFQRFFDVSYVTLLAASSNGISRVEATVLETDASKRAAGVCEGDADLCRRTRSRSSAN